MSYGYDLLNRFRTLVYVDRIPRSAKPGDLSAELPANWDFVVNRKTAWALGLTLPASIPVQATEIIG